MKTKILILVLVLSLVLTGLALANDGIELPRWVFGSGGTNSIGGSLTLRASLGQPVVGIVSNGEVTLGQGFWPGGSLAKDDFYIYLPLILK